MDAGQTVSFPTLWAERDSVVDYANLDSTGIVIQNSE
jgi:hypothetical protein